MDVRFYDENFNLIYIESLYKSVSWDILYNGAGTFEMCVSAESELCRIAFENTYLIATQGNNQAIITTKRLDEGSFVLYGRTMNYLLDKIMALPFQLSGEDAAMSVLYLVENYFPGVSMTCPVTRIGQSYYTVSKPQSLLKTICDILGEFNLGHDLYYNVQSKQWVFAIRQGQEISLSLSEDFLNMYAFEKEESVLDEAYGGYYYQNGTDMGSWNAATNTPTLSVTPSNYGKYYTVSTGGTLFGITWAVGDRIMCKDINGAFSKGSASETGFYKFVGSEKSGVKRSECYLASGNYNDAVAELARHAKKSSVTAKVKNVKLGEDYSLGDVVTLQKRIKGKNITEKARISGVTLWFENANEGEMPVFSVYKEE